MHLERFQAFAMIAAGLGVVTAYERLNRTTDSINEKFALYGAATAVGYACAQCILLACVVTARIRA